MPKLIEGKCEKHINTLKKVDMIFADIPDNIGLEYNEYKDNLPADQYFFQVKSWLFNFLETTDIVWLSFNTRYLPMIGHIACQYKYDITVKPCVQMLTFGQQQQNWLSDCTRPLWCFYSDAAKFYPDDIRIQSWRLQHGDKRADPRGKVPPNIFNFTEQECREYVNALSDEELAKIVRAMSGTDLFDFSRVTSSRQRRPWHPTQLHEGLVERCIRFSTKPKDHVLDPFAGTGTTLRVCKRIDRRCTLIESDSTYCKELRKEHRELC